MDQGLKYNHDAESLLEAVGITREDTINTAKAILKIRAGEYDHKSMVLEEVEKLLSGNQIAQRAIIIYIMAKFREFLQCYLTIDEVKETVGFDPELVNNCTDQAMLLKNLEKGIKLQEILS